MHRTMKIYLISSLFIIQVTVELRASRVELGSSCNQDNDCEAENSRCYQKQCSCLPFYAAYNTTSCLQSNMLGFECLIPEQCTKKVANSTCVGGICRCESGFLQFRRHTCLAGAKVGDICYSDAHCKLWDDDSHCDFMIANLFGRCLCNAPFKQSRSGTCLRSIPSPPTSTSQPLDFSYPLLTKTDIEHFSESLNKTTPSQNNKINSASPGASLKLHTVQKTPTKTKPEHVPVNRTDKPNTFFDKGKPRRPSPSPAPTTTAMGKVEVTTATKPTKPMKPDTAPIKPERGKPAKKPDQKLQQSNRVSNKTQQKLDELNEKIINFYHSAANAKPVKYSASTIKSDSDISTERFKSTTTSSFSKSHATLTKPSKPPKPSANVIHDSVPAQIKPNKTPVKHNETTFVKDHVKPLSADKILVINNQPKKPAKNKLNIAAHKTNLKHSFQTGFPFPSRDNITNFEESLLRFPINLDKRIETVSKMDDTSENKILTGESSTTGLLHHKITENGDPEIAVSLGYHCKADLQCMKNDNNSRCIKGVCDCVPRKTKLENTCSARNRGCHKGTFQCRSSGICISWFFVCDGRKDCADGSDEDCVNKTTCPEHTFQCGSSVPAVCISQASRCDGTADCPRGEDERNCTATKYKGCPLHTFQCEDGRCLPEYEFCNAVISCGDGSDEPNAACMATWNTSVRSLMYCPFRCSNGRCRSSAVVCSGRDGCGDSSDENRCSICKCSSAT